MKVDLCGSFYALNFAQKSVYLLLCDLCVSVVTNVAGKSNHRGTEKSELVTIAAKSCGSFMPSTISF